MSSITVEPLYNGHLWEPNFVRNSEVSLTKGLLVLFPVGVVCELGC